MSVYDAWTWKCACCDPVIPQITAAKHAKRRVTPLQADPSRTVSLIKRAFREVNIHFKPLKAAIRQLIVAEDALALKARRPLTILAESRRWQFETSAQKVSSFNKWLKVEVDKGILSAGDDAENAWTSKYIGSAYKKGVLRAYADTKGLAFVDKQDAFAQGKANFLNGVLGADETRSKLELLYTRTYEDLRGITSSMSTRMSRTLAKGLADGKGVLDITDALSREVDIGINRARVITRTEIMHAHAEGQLDAFQELGMDQVGVMAEWSTAGDDRVCPVCQPLEGVVLTIKEARGMIPRHPNCRCTWIPANVFEDEAKQKRSKGSVDKAVKTSMRRAAVRTVRKYGDDATVRRQSDWVGADKKIRGKASQPELKKR